MRLAEIEDWRRRLGRRGIGTAPSLNLLEITGLAGLADVALEPKLGFVAVCGGTGTGKTALLRVIHAGLSPERQGKILLPQPRFAETVVKLQVAYEDDVFARETRVGVAAASDGDGHEKGSRFLGLSDRTAFPSSFFEKSDVAIIKEGVTSSAFSDPDLAVVNAICRKEFSEIKVYEVDGPDDTVLPFFEVKEQELSYDSLSLSTGEMSALHIAWALSSSEPYSFLFIEEPEAFLPSISHNALFGLLSRSAVQRNLGLLVSTHSASIASQVERKSIMPITRHSGVSRILVGSESKARSLSRLGLKPTKHAVLLVEDDVSKSILVEIKGIYEFDAVCNIEIVDVREGAGGVKKAIESLPIGIETVAIVGVLDGDVRAEAEKWACGARLLFLPFRQAAEIEFLRDADGDPGKFGTILGRTEQEIRDALELTRGDNHHDRFKALPAALRQNEATVRSAALAHWMKGEGRTADVLKFAKELAGRLQVVLPSEM